MRRLSRSQAIWIIAALVIVVLALALYDPIMDAIFIDRDGLGDELTP